MMATHLSKMMATYLMNLSLMEYVLISICCGDQTPSWLPSSPKGEIVGDMMLSVVLDGNPLDEDDGNLLDEIVPDVICIDELVK